MMKTRRFEIEQIGEKEKKRRRKRKKLILIFGLLQIYFVKNQYLINIWVFKEVQSLINEPTYCTFYQPKSQISEPILKTILLAGCDFAPFAPKRRNFFFRRNRKKKKNPLDRFSALPSLSRTENPVNIFYLKNFQQNYFY